jgi:hypothetical protein
MDSPIPLLIEVIPSYQILIVNGIRQRHIFLSCFCGKNLGHPSKCPALSMKREFLFFFLATVFYSSSKTERRAIVFVLKQLPLRVRVCCLLAEARNTKSRISFLD